MEEEKQSEFTEALQTAASALQIVGTASSRQEQWEQLVNGINDLLIHQFDKLVGILYRLDVNETKLRRTIEEAKGTDAARLIAELIIERQVEKIHSRKKYRGPERLDDDEEKW